MLFRDIAGELRKYDTDGVSWQEPSIYVAEPWSPQSEAVVEWSAPKGGLPTIASKRLLMYLMGIRGALQFLGDDYDRMIGDDLVDEVCARLIEHVTFENAHRLDKPRSNV